MELATVKPSTALSDERGPGDLRVRDGAVQDQAVHEAPGDGRVLDDDVPGVGDEQAEGVAVDGDVVDAGGHHAVVLLRRRPRRPALLGQHRAPPAAAASVACSAAGGPLWKAPTSSVPVSESPPVLPLQNPRLEMLARAREACPPRTRM